MMSSSPNSDTTIPETMKRLVVISPGKTIKECKIEIQNNVPVPKPNTNEVLVKMIAAPINPSDYGSWMNASQDQCPLPMGNEGCGIIVQCGTSFMAKRYAVGTKVGVLVGVGSAAKKTQGSYSEYVTVSVTEGLFPMPDDLPIEDAASFFVNPYTTVAIMDTARKCGSKAFVHTAAASQLGQMMNKLAVEEGDVEIINVVRRDEQAKLLQDLGAKHVIVTNQDGWKTQLQSKIEELGATVAFDAVAGTGSGDLLAVLPKKGTVFVYGALAGPAGGYSPMDLIYYEKQVKGFLLTTWIRNGGMLMTIWRMMSTGRKVNAGLGNNGWSSTQFKDTTMEMAQQDIVSLMDKGVTGCKLRIRFDKG